ncbi:methylosome subunit pICln [Trichonephila clavipes]|nr:methylosome subunit pICln [Trichonephila clavipes]
MFRIMIYSFYMPSFRLLGCLVLQKQIMILVKRFPAPTEGIRHTQPNTKLFFESKCFGKGTLYITESALYWLSSSGTGISLQYPSITSNAISVCQDDFLEPCFFVTCSEKIVLNEDPDELLGAINSLNVSSDDVKKEDEEDEEEVPYEIFFVPDDADKLPDIFKAVNECLFLHAAVDDDDERSISPPNFNPFEEEDFDSDFDVV